MSFNKFIFRAEDIIKQEMVRSGLDYDGAVKSRKHFFGHEGKMFFRVQRTCGEEVRGVDIVVPDEIKQNISEYEI